MDIMLAIIGSSALGAIITCLFSLSIKKKVKALNFISCEKSEWRKKVQKIITLLSKCNFNNKDEKHLEEILIRLETCLNPYGKYDSIDYIHDGHIWEEISFLRKAESEEEFNQSKKNLICYLGKH